MMERYMSNELLYNNLREYTGSLDGCYCVSIDGSIWKDGVKVFPSEVERLEATKGMTKEEIDAYYKQLPINSGV